MHRPVFAAGRDKRFECGRMQLDAGLTLGSIQDLANDGVRRAQATEPPPGIGDKKEIADLGV